MIKLVIVLLVLSIIMMALPDFALDVMVIVPAVGFLIYGAVSIVYFAVNKNSAGLTKSYLVWPIIAIVIGILLLSFLKEVEYTEPPLIIELLRYQKAQIHHLLEHVLHRVLGLSLNKMYFVLQRHLANWLHLTL